MQDKSAEDRGQTSLSRTGPESGPTGDNSIHERGMLLYKPGQGYWVRVLTASCLLLLSAAAAAWMWSQVEAVSVPMDRWVLSSGGVTGTPQNGQVVQLLEAPKAGAEQAVIGTAKIENVTGDEKRPVITVGSVEIKNERSVREVRQLDGPGVPAAFTATITRAEGLAKFDKAYLTGGAAGLTFLVGAALTYYYVGRRPKSVDFLVSTDAEMKKVNWSTRKAVIDSTMVVIGACFLISGFLFVVDMLFRGFFQAIGVLSH